jgi:hypothetical protein
MEDGGRFGGFSWHGVVGEEIVEGRIAWRERVCDGGARESSFRSLRRFYGQRRTSDHQRSFRRGVGSNTACPGDRVLIFAALRARGSVLEPRWFLTPYLAIWAVRSQAEPGCIGWWAISGDVPTDYLPCTSERDNTDVLLSFSRVWHSVAAYMAEGQWAPNHEIGPPGQQRELAPLLIRRAEMLEELARDMNAAEGEG